MDLSGLQWIANRVTMDLFRDNNEPSGIHQPESHLPARVMDLKAGGPLWSLNHAGPMDDRATADDPVTAAATGRLFLPITVSTD